MSVASTTAGTRPGAGVSVRRNPAAPWRHVDVVLVVAAGCLAALGLLMVYSATRQRLAADDVDVYRFVAKQSLFVGLGLVLMVGAMVVDYRVFRDFSPLIYGTTVLVLVAVLSPLGSQANGTQGWFQLGSFQLQPSEFAKLALIVCVGAYAAQHRGALNGKRLLAVIGLAAVPMGLIYLQGDLGTALVFVVVLMGMLLVAGARLRHIVAITMLGVIGVVLVVQLGVLKQYQLNRLTAFLDPTSDTQRSTYNLNQSKIAISSGGFTGRGLFKGPQTNLSYVPEQHTDFIFTVVGEELGFVGAAVLLTLFAIVVWRTWRTAMLSKDLFGTLLCVGVLTMIVFQLFENVGMTMGIMPITGIPLPLISYGGSSVLAVFIGLGLVLNVHMRRFT